MKTVKDPLDIYGMETSNMHEAALSIKNKYKNKDKFVDLYWSWLESYGLKKPHSIKALVDIKLGEFNFNST